MPIKNSFLSLVFAFLICGSFTTAFAETNADYAHTPLFISNSVTPNVMILIDNSGSMNDMAYKTAYSPTTSYYGYFSPSLRYRYASSRFNIDAGGNWSGNFLNWATMRRIDVSRKVLTGGKATSRTGNGITENLGDNGSGWNVKKTGNNADAATLAPYVGAKYDYILDNGKLKIEDNGTGNEVAEYDILVEKNAVQEPTEFLNGDLAGIMQKVANQARWGISFFNSTGQGAGEGGGGGSKDGSYVSQHITGTGYGANFITDIENTSANNWTPLGESLYQIAGYFAQSSSIRYDSGNYTINQAQDPYYFSSYSSSVSCAKSFVLIITDGIATMDSNIPAAAPISGGNLQDYDGDGNDATPTAGSFYQSNYLDDVALWSHTIDLRPDLANTQSLTTYVVYAFGDSSAAKTLLQDTAKNGGFIDTDGSNTPNITGEWDSDGDGIPDTYYEASDGTTLEANITSAITDILKRSSSGTALSVLGTSASGSGNVYQAYFLPAKTIIGAAGSSDIQWLGHLISLNIDSFGSLRDKNNTCINFVFDKNTNQTNVQNLTEAVGRCTVTTTGVTSLSSWTNYNWDAGEILAQQTWTDRKVYGFLDLNNDGITDGGEIVTLGSLNAYSKYLGVPTAAEAADVVNFVRGEGKAGLRDRTDENGDEWKLGDIIDATPTIIGAPMEAYHIQYKDKSYAEYLAFHKSRSAMVYVGANDGQLHAFDGTTGSEKWSLVPYNLLPHLRWLKETTYAHVDYMDAKAKATDVQTFGCDTNHLGATNGKCWGTILLAGMRMGGGEISDNTFDIDGNGDAPVSNQRKFTSSYVALDVTDASSTTPKVLWEFGHNLDKRFPALVSGVNELGFTLSQPAVAKVGGKWFAIFSSGSKAAYVPDYNGDSTQSSNVFIVDIEDGSLKAMFTVTDTNSMLLNPIAIDIDFNSANTVIGSGTATYNSEAIYIPETYKSGGIYRGRVWRIATKGDADPANWDMRLLFTTNDNEAITSPPASSSDNNGNIWVYFGTGKYYSDADKVDVTTQTFYGIKDPCWDAAALDWDNACLASSSSAASGAYGAASVTNSTAGLIDTTNAIVSTSGTVSGVTGGAGAPPATFTELETLADDSDGWFFNFTTNGERNLNKPAVVGGLVLLSSFIPSNDVCGFGGSSFFYAVFYKTGTAFKKSTIGTSGTTILRKELSGSTGLASSVAVHAGQESGVQAYIQLSTGETKAISVETATDIKSGIISWRIL